MKTEHEHKLEVHFILCLCQSNNHNLDMALQAILGLLFTASQNFCSIMKFYWFWIPHLLVTKTPVRLPFDQLLHPPTIECTILDHDVSTRYIMFETKLQELVLVIVMLKWLLLLLMDVLKWGSLRRLTACLQSLQKFLLHFAKNKKET